MLNFIKINQAVLLQNIIGSLIMTGFGMFLIVLTGVRIPTSDIVVSTFICIFVFILGFYNFIDYRIGKFK
jgi:hypothetical protein